MDWHTLDYVLYHSKPVSYMYPNTYVDIFPESVIHLEIPTYHLLRPDNRGLRGIIGEDEAVPLPPPLNHPTYISAWRRGMCLSLSWCGSAPSSPASRSPTPPPTSTPAFIPPQFNHLPTGESVSLSRLDCLPLSSVSVRCVFSVRPLRLRVLSPYFSPLKPRPPSFQRGKVERNGKNENV